MAKYKAKQKKYSYAKAVTIVLFALMFIGAVAGCVIGWLQVNNLTAKLNMFMQTKTEESGVQSSEAEKAPIKTTSELVAPSSATTYAVVTEGTYTALPEGARNIRVGDDLSGALLYIDYPNLNLNSTSSGEYIGTSTYYKIGRQNMQNQPFGYGKFSSASASFTSILFTDYFVATNSGMGFSTSWKLNPITSYKLPEDFGTVTNVDTSKPEHTALYIVEGGTSGGEEETPTYTVTDTSPLPGHGFECGSVFYLNNDVKSYAEGYLCINVKALKPLMSQSGSSSVNVMIINSQNGLKIENGALNYVYMGAGSSGGSEQKTFKLCDGSATSDYIYFEIDLQNVSMINSEYVTSDTMRYLTDLPHEHLTTETAFPVAGCTSDCVMQLKDGMTYVEGYLVIKTAAFRSFAATHTGRLFYTDNHNYNYFEVENGALKYSQYLGGPYNSMTVYDGNTETEYFYVHLNGMTLVSGGLTFGSSIIGYLTTEHQNYTLPEQPEKEGYDFAGWFYGTEADHKEAESNASKTCSQYTGEHITTDTSFHAHFTIKRFTVTYDTNGVGEISPETVDWNTSAPIPSINRTGYNLAGWYLPDGTAYTGQAVTGDITLKAEWVIKVFTVTFYVEGKPVKTMNVSYGTQLTEVSEAANIALQNILAASYINEDIPGVALTEMLVVDDMEVQLLSTTSMDKLMSVLQQYRIILIVCAVIACAGAVTATVFITKKLNGRR